MPEYTIFEKLKRGFEKLTRGSPDSTRILAGHSTFTVEQLEDEINMDSEIGKKLKTIEKELEKY